MGSNQQSDGEMSEVRMGEIALALFFAKVDQDGGVKVSSNFRRELGDMAKKTNIPVGDLEEFYKQILVRAIGRAFGMQRVSLRMSDPVKIRFGVGSNDEGPGTH